MTTIESRLAEIEARAKAATPGPWMTGLDDDGHQAITGPKDESIGCIFCWRYELPPMMAESEANADFCAAARTDIPRLVAALRVAVDELAQFGTSGDYHRMRVAGEMSRIEAALRGDDHAAD